MPELFYLAQKWKTFLLGLVVFNFFGSAVSADSYWASDCKPANIEKVFGIKSKAFETSADNCGERKIFDLLNPGPKYEFGFLFKAKPKKCSIFSQGERDHIYNDFTKSVDCIDNTPYIYSFAYEGEPGALTKKLGEKYGAVLKTVSDKPFNSTDAVFSLYTKAEENFVVLRETNYTPSIGDKENHYRVFYINPTLHKKLKVAYQAEIDRENQIEAQTKSKKTQEGLDLVK